MRGGTNWHSDTISTLDVQFGPGCRLIDADVTGGLDSQSLVRCALAVDLGVKYQITGFGGVQCCHVGGTSTVIVPEFETFSMIIVLTEHLKDRIRGIV